MQPQFGRDGMKNRLKRCSFTKTTINGPKIEKLCFFIIRANNFEEHMSHVWGGAKKHYRDLPSTPLSVVNCALAGTLPAEAKSLRALRGGGGLNKWGKVAQCGVGGQQFG